MISSYAVMFAGHGEQTPVLIFSSVLYNLVSHYSTPSPPTPPTRLMVSASQDGKLLIWDTHTGNKVRLPLKGSIGIFLIRNDRSGHYLYSVSAPTPPLSPVNTTV